LFFLNIILKYPNIELELIESGYLGCCVTSFSQLNIGYPIDSKSFVVCFVLMIIVIAKSMTTKIITK